MKPSLKANLDTLHQSDIFTLMLFILYKVQDLADYAVLSELCFLLDGSNLIRLLTYFAGKTIKFPTEEEMATLANALLLYQYINIDGESLASAVEKLKVSSQKQKDDITQLYLQILPIMAKYNVDRGQIKQNAR